MKGATKYLMTSIVLFFEEKGCKLKPYPKVALVNDPKNAQDALGLTGYCEPDANKIVIFVANRHVKDILRTFAHELIHRHQFNVGIPGYEEVGYTNDQKVKDNPLITKMEAEAYLKGNMMFREWEEELKLNPSNKDLRELLRVKWNTTTRRTN